MASLADGLYSTNAYQMRGDLSQPLKVSVISDVYGKSSAAGGVGMATRPVPEGMEQTNVWSSWKTGGSDRVPADYPCSNSGQLCASGNSTVQPCGQRSMILRENSVWGDVVGSADGTGYVTTNWLPPSTPAARLGFCWISRKVVETGPTNGEEMIEKTVGGKKVTILNDQKYSPGSVSQLFIDDKPLLRYWSGVPFLFKSEQTPFVYMVPNAIWVKTGGAKYRLDTVSAQDRGEGCACGWCGECIGY